MIPIQIRVIESYGEMLNVVCAYWIMSLTLYDSWQILGPENNISRSDVPHLHCIRTTTVLVPSMSCLIPPKLTTTSD